MKIIIGPFKKEITNDEISKDFFKIDFQTVVFSLKRCTKKINLGIGLGSIYPNIFIREEIDYKIIDARDCLGINIWSDFKDCDVIIIK